MHRRAPCQVRRRAPRFPAMRLALRRAASLPRSRAAPAARRCARGRAPAPHQLDPANRASSARTRLPRPCLRAGNRSSAAPATGDNSPASQSTFKCRDTRGWLCPRTAAMSVTDSSAVASNARIRNRVGSAADRSRCTYCSSGSFMTCIYKEVINLWQAEIRFSGDLFDFWGQASQTRQRVGALTGEAARYRAGDRPPRIRRRAAGGCSSSRS